MERLISMTRAMTVHIDDEVVKWAKIRSLETNVRLNAFIENLIRKEMEKIEKND